jgi:hypothetical protein
LLYNEKNKKKITATLRKLSKESGIPYNTLRDWWYEENYPKNEATATKAEENQMCRLCGSARVECHSSTGKPYSHGLCSRCRKKRAIAKKRDRDATKKESMVAVCLDCNHVFYVKIK